MWDELVLNEVRIEIVRGSALVSTNETFYTEWGKLKSRVKLLNTSSMNLPVVHCADLPGCGFEATTAAENQELSYNECEKILRSMEHLQLYFVVPDWNAESFPKQSFKG